MKAQVETSTSAIQICNLQQQLSVAFLDGGLQFGMAEVGESANSTAKTDATSSADLTMRDHRAVGQPRRLKSLCRRTNLIYAREEVAARRWSAVAVGVSGSA